eukprot:815658-Pleurochrysis_carterae.AAC.1
MATGCCQTSAGGGKGRNDVTNAPASVWGQLIEVWFAARERICGLANERRTVPDRLRVLEELGGGN